MYNGLLAFQIRLPSCIFTTTFADVQNDRSKSARKFSPFSLNRLLDRFSEIQDGHRHCVVHFTEDRIVHWRA